MSDEHEAYQLLRIQHSLAVALSSTSDLKVALDLILAAAVQTRGIDCGGIYISNKQGGLDLACHKGLSESFIRGVSHYEPDSPNVSLVRSGKPIYSRYKNVKPGHNEALLQENLRALAVIPVLFKGELVAILNLASHIIDEIPKSVRDTLETISGWIGGVIARVKAEEELRESQQRLQAYLKSFPIMVFSQDRELRYTWFYNPYPLQVESIIGHTDEELFPPVEYARLTDLKRRVLETGVSAREEVVVTLNDEKRFFDQHIEPFYDITNRIAGITCVAIDITARKNIEREMDRLERLNLVGEMAAGIGHEIRNPMTTIRGFLQFLGEKKDCAVYKEYFDIMTGELDRANSIITEFLSLARNKAIDLKMRSLNIIIMSIYPLIEADALVTDKYIETDLNAIPDFPLDEKEIRQLILNLVRNGLEAMPAGGKLKLKTYVENGNVVLAVQDHGTGIDAQVLTKIGTPFLTTKDQGTGLGLPVCYRIAERHNAAIAVDTSPHGTTFYVRFKS